MKSVKLTATIDAKENRDTANVDTPNAFVQTDFKGETVIIKVRCEMAEILIKCDPER